MGVQHLNSHFLTRCLRSGRDDDLDSELGRIDVESWRQLVDRAEWHGVAPLLYHRLRHIENLVIPQQEGERLHHVYLHNLLKNRSILEQLSEIVREITEAGCSVLVLKGACLSYCVYQEAALRPMADIDLLVRSQDAEKVQRHLNTIGYRYTAGSTVVDYSRHHHQRPISKVGSVGVVINVNEVSHFLGNHIEMKNQPKLDYPIRTTFQPNEHQLSLKVDDFRELFNSIQEMGNKPIRKAHKSFIIYPL